MAINAAIPGAFDLVSFKEKYPNNYDDVDIAEQIGRASCRERV